MRTRSDLALLALPLLASTACAPALPPGPNAPTTAADATGRTTVTPVAGPTVPFIVDWKAEDRGDLEEAVADGVAVVAFDAQGLRVLKRCHLKGDYGYLPLEPKQDVVRFDSARDVQANLPVGGAGLVAKIGGGFAQGKTLDLAYVMIGKRRTTWTDPTSDDLDGKCEGATHYVRAMTVGAFAMTTGSRQKAHAAAEVFAVSAGGSTSSTSEVATTDGNLTACMGANADSDRPPAGCRSLLRLELEPIVRGEGGKARPAPAPPPDGEKPKARVEARRAIDCGPGLAFVDGKCTASAAAEAPRACDPASFADCDAQCQRGDAASCDQAGYLMVTGAAGAVDDARANALFEKACNADVLNGCVNLGVRLLFGTPAKMGSPRGLAPLDKACRAGDARGCSIVGDALFVSLGGVPKDAAKAVRYYTRGCDGGDTSACTNLGVLYLGAGGADVPTDRRKALALSSRACFGGDSTACGNTGVMYEFGLGGVAQDITKAQGLFKRACGIDGANCLRLGILYQHGTGFARDDALAASLFERSCAEVGRPGTGGFPSLACHVLEKVYGKPARKLDARALDMTVDVMRPQCAEKLGRACSFQGVAASALGQAAEGRALIDRGCSLGDPWACDLAKRMKR